jgi:hypothetical protein
MSKRTENNLIEHGKLFAAYMAASYEHNQALRAGSAWPDADKKKLLSEAKIRLDTAYAAWRDFLPEKPLRNARLETLPKPG